MQLGFGLALFFFANSFIHYHLSVHQSSSVCLCGVSCVPASVRECGVDWGTTRRSWLSFHYVDQVIKFGVVPFLKTEPSCRPHFMLFLNSDFYWYLYFFRRVANTFLPCPLLITLWHYYIQFCKEMGIRNCWVWNHFLDSSHSVSSVCGMNGEARSHLCVCVALGIGPKPVWQARSCFNTWLHPQPQSCKLMKGMSEMLDFLIFLVRKPILHLIVFCSVKNKITNETCICFDMWLCRESWSPESLPVLLFRRTEAQWLPTGTVKVQDYRLLKRLKMSY